jgi:hypothetical protein
LTWRSDASLGPARKAPEVGNPPWARFSTVTITLGDFDRQQDTILIHSLSRLHLLESTESIGLQAPQRILYRRPHRRYWMTFTRLSDGRPLREGSSFERMQRLMRLSMNTHASRLSTACSGHQTLASPRIVIVNICILSSASDHLIMQQTACEAFEHACWHCMITNTPRSVGKLRCPPCSQ